MSEPVDVDLPSPSAEAREFLLHLSPVVEALGGQLVDHGSAQPADTAVVWRSEIVGYLRSAELHGVLERLVARVEQETGCGLDEMSRSEKQTAVRRLDELGAFLLRGAVEDIAQLMGVSRVTLYSYLNAIRPKD